MRSRICSDCMERYLSLSNPIFIVCFLSGGPAHHTRALNHKHKYTTARDGVQCKTTRRMQFRQDRPFWAVSCPVFCENGACANVLALSGANAPDSPFCRCATSSPGAGEVLPQRESPWQSTQASSLCQSLSLWERWICEAKTERARMLTLLQQFFRERVVVESIRLCKRKRDRRSVRQSPLLL